MALSEDEQRLLDQLEAALAAEDPKLASTLRGTGTRRLHKRRATFAGIGFLVGIGCLIGGMELHPLVSVLGFLIMLAATVVAVSSWHYVGLDADGRPASGPGRGGGSDKDFMGRMEDRWRRRQDEGL